MHRLRRPSLIPTHSPLSLLLIALLLMPFVAGPSRAQVALDRETPAPGVVQADGQLPGYTEPPWSQESPLYWTAPDDPNLSLIATADLISQTAAQQVWHAEAADAMTGDLIVSLDATITYSTAGALWDVSFERFSNRFGFAPIPLSNSIELIPPDPNGDNQTAATGDLTWMLVLLSANALSVPANGGESVNLAALGCNWPCSKKWNLCCAAHDICYAIGGNAKNRKFCDGAFAVCLAIAGMPPNMVKVYYLGVRLFGWIFFNFTPPPPVVVPVDPQQPVEPGVGLK